MNIKKFFTVAVLTLTASLQGWSMEKADYQVIPLPQNIVEQKGDPFVVRNGAVIVYVSEKQSTAEVDRAMKRNAAFVQQYVKEEAGLSLGIQYNKVKKQPTIQLTINPKLTTKEGYRLTVNTKGITIEGATPQAMSRASRACGPSTWRRSIRLRRLPTRSLPQPVNTSSAYRAISGQNMC